jgi:WD40 repeat protein/serine/threonine protein kinase
MSKPPLQRVEALFHQAAILTPEERSTFLNRECADNTELRVAVEELLRHDPGAGSTSSFLVSPIERATAEVPTVPGSRARVSESSGATFPTIPGYELLGELGRGGMGVVYKARQVGLKRVVALKMLLTGAPATAEQLARFRTEAEALARLQHPNIVQIYEVGEHDRRPFFVMEYVNGPSLAHQLDGLPQAFRSAAQLVEVLARALHAVHQCHIIHRDLKPANILLSSVISPSSLAENEGREPNEQGLKAVPKITDFGLARDLTAKQRLTQIGLAMGTPCYMAPEQARGETSALGPPTDIYALGAILYEMLTGRPPFEGASAAETISQACTAEPLSPARLRPKLPRDLEIICLKCLEKDPRKRYARASELAEDLRRFQSGEPIRARPVSLFEHIGRWCRRRPLVAALLAVCAALALSLFVTVLLYNARLRQKVEEEREQLVHLNVTLGVLELGEGNSFSALLRYTEALRLDEGNRTQERKHRMRIATVLRQSPGLVQLFVPEHTVCSAGLGSALCWAVTVADGRVVRVWDVMTGEPASPDLKHDSVVLLTAVSPDCRLLATACRDDTVRIWDISSGKPRLPPLPQGGPVARLAFHINGQMVLTRRADSVVQLWKVTTGERVALQGLAKDSLAFSTFDDDGGRVFTLAADHTGRVWNAATGEAVGTSLKIKQDVVHGAVSPDGHRVALVGADHAIRIWDVATGKPLTGPLRQSNQIIWVFFDASGDRIIAGGDEYAAQVWRVSTGEPLTPPLRHNGPVRQGRFSPDGRLVVTSSSDNTARVWDAATGEAVTPALEHNGTVNYAAFSPEGKRLITVGKDDTVRLWELTPAREPAIARPVEDVPAALVLEARSPDGRRLIKWLNHSTVQVTDAASGIPIGPPLRHGSKVTHAGFSPEGGRVVTASDDNTAQVWSADTGARLTPPLPHKGTVLHAAFDSAGERIVTASEDRTARVWDADTGEPLTPSLNHSCAVVRACFSPDGNQAITFGSDRVAHTWDLTPTDQPVPVLVLLAQVLSGSHIDEKHGLLPLERERLRAAWQKLRFDRPMLTGPAPRRR